MSDSYSLILFKPSMTAPLPRPSISQYSDLTGDKLASEHRDTLFTEFTPLVRRLIRQYGGDNVEMREDLRGEIYWRFTQLFEDYDDERGVPFRPYVVRKLSAAAYTFARQHWRLDRREMTLDFGDGRGDQGPSFDPTGAWLNSLSLDQVRSVLPHGIAQLPRRQRQVVVWRYYDQMAFEDIAGRLQIQVATARSILRHGLNNLRKWTNRENIEFE